MPYSTPKFDYHFFLDTLYRLSLELSHTLPKPSQTCCKLWILSSTCIKLVDKKTWKSTCSKPVDNLQQTCYHQAMQTHPDIGLMTAIPQACSRLAATYAFLAVHSSRPDRRQSIGLGFQRSYVRFPRWPGIFSSLSGVDIDPVNSAAQHCTGVKIFDNVIDN